MIEFQMYHVLTQIPSPILPFYSVPRFYLPQFLSLPACLRGRSFHLHHCPSVPVPNLPPKAPTPTKDQFSCS